MNDQDKSRDQLLHEVAALRQHVAEVEAALSEHRQATEAELHRHIAQYRSLFEHSPISLWEEDFSDVKRVVEELRAGGVTDFAAWFEEHLESAMHCARLVKIIRVNRATLRLFKAADESELIASLPPLFDECALEIFGKELAALANGETYFASEIVHKTLRNEPLNTIVQVSIAPGHEEDWGQVLVSVLDLTERVQADIARQESESRFRTAFLTSPDAINVNRLSDGLYVDINEGFTTLTGFTAADVLGKTSEEIGIWADMHDRERLVKGLRATGHVRDLEARFRYKDGKLHAGLMSARIIQFGGELCILSISRDISERKAAEAALHESEENYRVLVENSPDFIARFDTSTRIIFANTAVLRELEHTHGLREDQIIGRTYREMGLSPELCNFCEEKIRAVSASGQAYETEYAYESGPKRMHVNWRLIPELDEQGRTKSILSLSRDITEQKRLEAASRKAEVLSAELKKEKEIIALKERFISTVSHEFRAPLSVIKTSSDLLDRYLDKLPVERRQKLIQQIGQQIEHMTDLIDDTLDLTRAQAGKTEFSPTWLDLEPFCRALFDQTMFANDCRHQFEYVSHAPAEAVWVDGRLLRHILTNLLSNAIKYTPDNAKIRFELDHTADTVIFRITDEGIGIPEKDQGRLFEPFHRAENAGNIKGTGLGLAIVKQYVEVHRGRIDVDSQEGLGSTFSVYLPRT